MFAAIAAIEYHLPETKLTNQQLEATFPDWTAQKILEKTGIEERCRAAPGECASDLAVRAAQKLFASGACSPARVDFLLLCTQGADHPLPATACILQDRLGLSTQIGALDYTLGCSGFVYGLSLAKGLIESRQASNVLLLTAEVMNKFLHPDDRGSQSLFGDAAAATLIQARANCPSRLRSWIEPVVFGTDGCGRDYIIVRGGGMRHQAIGDRDDADSINHLYMHGPEVLTFTLGAVPKAIDELLNRANLQMDDVDLFVFHQANGYMLEQLRVKMDIPEDKFILALRHCGNTVSSSIPIALKEAQARGQMRPGMRVMLVGFGVGFSWSATLIQS